jgi:cytochrome P450
MLISESPTVPTPSHVPPERVRDLDYLHPEGATGEKDVLLAWKKIQDTSPDIFWTPRHGGHWVFTRAEDIETAQLDYARFSMRGNSIPMNLTPTVPVELDPPEHGPVRAALSPFFAPRVVKILTERVLAITTALIDQIQPRGTCEFVEDFARQLPIILFLEIVDLPVEDRSILLPLVAIRNRGEDPKARHEAKVDVLNYLKAVISSRSMSKGDDLLSNMLHSKINGEPISDEVSQGLLAQLMFAGLDTVANLLGFIARALALDGVLRKQLREDPASIPKAIDELIRRHSVVCMARLITRDMDYKGVHLKEGEQVLVPYILHSLDEALFPDPLSIDISRTNAAKHVVFGNGPHRCPAAMLARAEIRVFLEEWLSRIPEFEIDPDDEVIVSGGRVCGVTRLPLRWQV